MDVLDRTPPDGEAVVYEVETECTPARESETFEQYCNWIIRDCIVLLFQNAPDECKRPFTIRTEKRGEFGDAISHE